jgi:endonuclease/exonuclease/phosphatase (EEP) superfamily protein YafD
MSDASETPEAREKDLAAESPSRADRLLRAVRGALFCGTAAFVALLALLYLVVSDRTWWSECITIWPPLLWGFLLVPLAALTLEIRRPRRALVLFVAIALFFLFTVEWRSLLRWGEARGEEEFAQLRATPSRGAHALRVVTWNIDGNRNVLPTLAALDPDLCFLQETPDGDSSFQPADLTGPWDGFIWDDAGDCGVLSRWPVQRLPTRRVGPWTPPQILEMTWPDGERLLLGNVRLVLPSLELSVFLPTRWRRLRREHSARLEQFSLLAALLDETQRERGPAPLVLAGDFNNTGGLASHAPLRALLGDVWPVAGRGWGATLLDRWPVARIDQCWVSREIEPVAARVQSTGLSDHRPLVVDLIVRDQGP